MFERLKNGLKKTRAAFGQGLANLFLGKKAIDAALFEDLETLLLSADVGMEATRQIIQELTQQTARKHLNDSEALFQALRKILIDILKPCEKTLDIASPQDNPARQKPLVLLFAGINGAGKTTTIGKLAKQLKNKGQKIILAAGDTFRAAAIEQLQAWGERNKVPVIAQEAGADSAAVVFDAFQAAKARGMDILLADTAGRLHTQQHLIEELKKVKRVLAKIDPHAPHEVLLVLDASIGQNALVQARQFHEALGVTGLVITKMDGTAKGGVLFSIAQNLTLPLYYIGVGETIEDLQEFHAESFVDALLQQQ